MKDIEVSLIQEEVLVDQVVKSGNCSIQSNTVTRLKRELEYGLL